MTDDLIKETKFKRAISEEELMGCIDCSIRTTLIVSDEAGYDIVKELFKGFNLNHTILNIVIYDEQDTASTEELYKD